MHARVQRDLFVPQPDNWGLTLLVRTGSAAFSTVLLARWKRRSRRLTTRHAHAPT